MKQLTKTEKLLKAQQLLEEAGLQGINIAELMELQENGRESDSSTRFNEFTLKQRVFIAAYRRTFGNITQAAKAAKIDRTTFYNWKNDTPGFADYIDNIEPSEELLDFGESKLLQLVNSGDTAATIFLLKTKGKKRGYVERFEQDIADERDRMTLFIPDNGRDNYQDAVVLDPKQIEERKKTG